MNLKISRLYDSTTGEYVTPAQLGITDAEYADLIERSFAPDAANNLAGRVTAPRSTRRVYAQ